MDAVDDARRRGGARTVLIPAPPARARAASPRFDAAVLLASLWFVGGLLVDGWAHSNLDLSREGFFTPYHAIFYSGFVAVAAIVLARAFRAHVPGQPWRAAVPPGYAGTLAGLAVFAAGGILDMFWHLAFGIEQDVAALFSPTHLVLGCGIGLILTGPIRATLARDPARSFAAQWPALVALGLFGTLVMFFTLWVFSTFLGARSDPQVVYPLVSGAPLGELRESWQIRGMAAIVIRTIVTMGLLAWASRRLRLPFGASVLVIGMPNVSISVMLGASPAIFADALLASAVAGIAADVASSRGITLDGGDRRARALWFAVPFLFWATFVALSSILTRGSWWPIHMLAGAPVFAGLASTLLGLSAERPAPRSVTAPDAAVAPSPALDAARKRSPKRRARNRAKPAK